DLLVAWREFPKHPGISKALSRCAGVQNRNELPERAGNARGGERSHLRKRSAIPQTSERDPRIKSVEAGVGGAKQWRGASAICRPANSRVARRRSRSERDRRALPRALSCGGAATGAFPARHPL